MNKVFYCYKIKIIYFGHFNLTNLLTCSDLFGLVLYSVLLLVNLFVWLASFVCCSIVQANSRHDTDDCGCVSETRKQIESNLATQSTRKNAQHIAQEYNYNPPAKQRHHVHTLFQATRLLITPPSMVVNWIAFCKRVPSCLMLQCFSFSVHLQSTT